MNMRWIIVLFALVFTLSAEAQTEPAAKQPNIVMIMIDDAALMDLGVYGGEAQTPHIDCPAPFLWAILI